MKYHILIGAGCAAILCVMNVSALRMHTTSSTASVFAETFSGRFKIPESGRMNRSINTRWWLSSGAYLFAENGIGRTVSGALPIYDPWRILFSISNPVDTDFGYHPQNIFRLVSKTRWNNFRQEAYFRITAINLSASPNRNASNGLFFFNRYQDEHNVYYTGIRVDGYAVIKKKVAGTYTTLAYTRALSGDPYDRSANPNLLPNRTWIGLRSDVVSLENGAVLIKVYIDRDTSGTWELVAQATDDGTTGGPPITREGYTGIRTDFMDVQFSDYRVWSP